jgi:hypothetical protein
VKAQSLRQPGCIRSGFCIGGTAQRTLNNSCSELQNLGLPYRLGLIGDLGQTENSAQTLEHLMANKPDSVLNVRELLHTCACWHDSALVQSVMLPVGGASGFQLSNRNLRCLDVIIDAL